MIKANELRKGVIVIDYTGIVREVAGEDIQQQCWHEEGQTGTTEAPLNPIPLTTEWLERCGLTQKTIEHDDLPQWQNFNMNIAQYTDGFYLYTITSDPWHDQAVGKKIEFVHTLQNISLDLFGEELKIDIP